MALETATYIDALVTSNPDGADARSTADDHLRLIKAALKRSFPMIGGAVSASDAALSKVNDLSVSAQAQLNSLRDGAETAKYALVATTAVTATNALGLGGQSAGAFVAVGTANVFTANQRISKTVPVLEFYESSQSLDRRNWRIGASGLTMFLGPYTDSATAGYNGLVITRSATYVQSFAFTGGAITFNGVALDNPLQMNGVAAASYARLDTARTFSGGTGNTPVTASPSTGTVQLNCSNGDYQRLTLTGNVTLSAPLAPRPGQVLVLRLTQGGTGSYTVTWDTVFRFAAGITPTLTTTVGAHDVFAFIYDDVLGYWLQAGLDVKR